MIRVRRFGDVTQLAMARTVFGRPLFVTCACVIDGLLLDVGPPATQAEFGRLLSDLRVNQVVLSHAHPLAVRTLIHPPRQRLYCSSGKVIDDGRTALQRKLDFMERLRDDTRDRHIRGIPATAIRQELLGSEDWWIAVTAGHFSKQNLIDALLRPEA